MTCLQNRSLSMHLRRSHTYLYWVRCFLVSETSFEKRDYRQRARYRHYPPSNYRELPRVNVHAYSTSSQVRTSGALIFALRSRGRLNVAPARSQFSIAPMCRHVSHTSVHVYVHAAASAADEFEFKNRVINNRSYNVAEAG